jgi:hypothetical protein
VQVSIVEQEGNRPRPGRDVVVTVLADEGVFEASGKEDDGVTVPLGAR